MALHGRHHTAGHALLHSHFVLLAVLATLALPCALQPVFAHLAPEHNCVHDSLKQVHRTSPQQYRDPGWDALPGGGRIRRRRLAQEEWGQLRIATYYNLDGTNPVKEAYVRDSVVPQAVQLLEAALRVDSVVGNLFAARPCYSYWTASGTCYSFQDPPYCGHTQLPESHIGDTTYCLDGPASGCSTEPAGGDGVPDADFLIYVTVQQTTTCGTNTLACTLLLGEEIGGVALQSFGLCVHHRTHTLPPTDAASCSSDQFDRPTHAYFNFCPDLLDTDPENLQAFVNTARHEIIHGMGFSAAHYAFFRDADGNPLVTRNSAGYPASQAIYCSYPYPLPNTNVIQAFSERGYTAWKLVMPTLVDAASDHFGCGSVNGVELNNQATTCFPFGSHWEERILKVGGCVAAGRGGSERKPDTAYSRRTR